MELGYILLKTLPKAISMYMELEVALDAQFTKIDLVMLATGKLQYFVPESFIPRNLIFQVQLVLEAIKSPAESLKKDCSSVEMSAYAVTVKTDSTAI